MSVIIKDDKNQRTKPKVNIIAPRKKFTPAGINPTAKKRVSAYCRVSTDSDEQELSFETQCDFYRKLINETPNYTFVDVYADEGITGTSTLHREGFKRMMEDARLGKMDMIITKSVTRFARNTVDSIDSLRKLKEYGVDVYFELENLHSLEANEMLMTILSSVAQQSSEEKSHSVKWGYQRQFENGKVYAPNLFGYKSSKGTLEIIESEAKTVREVFEMYLSGMSEISIAKELTSRGVMTKRGKTKWTAGVINRMLQNEKYTGDAIMKKTYNIDFLHKKRLSNNGHKTKYHIENSHPAIISREMFKEAQIERTRRTVNDLITENLDKHDSKSRYTGKNPLSNRIICSDCGSFFRRAVWRKRNGEKEPVWRCSNKLNNGKEACPHSVTLKESLLLNELGIMINSKLNSKDKTKSELAKVLSDFVNPKDIKTRQDQINKELLEVENKIKELLDKGMLLVSRGVQDESLLEEHLEQCNITKRKLKDELQSLDQKLNAIKQSRQNKILTTLDQKDFQPNEMTQEEISVFIKHIVVTREKLQVTTMDEQIQEIELSQVM